MRPRLGGRIARSADLLRQRAGGQGEAGAGAGDGAGSGAMAVGAGRGAARGGFFFATGFFEPAGPAGCNSTKTGFGTRRGASASLPSPAATTRTGTVCG